MILDVLWCQKWMLLSKSQWLCEQAPKTEYICRKWRNWFQMRGLEVASVFLWVYVGMILHPWDWKMTWLSTISTLKGKFSEKKKRKKKEKATTLKKKIPSPHGRKNSICKLISCKESPTQSCPWFALNHHPYLTLFILNLATLVFLTTIWLSYTAVFVCGAGFKQLPTIIPQARIEHV